MALSKGRPMRKPIAITIIIAIAAALAVLAPTAAPAQEPKFLSGVTILDAVVDTDYPYFATVTVSVTCLMDIPSPGYVVATATLTQSNGSGHLASAFRPGAGGFPCQAGQVLVIPLRFGNRTDIKGRFLPGPADIHGFIEAFIDCCTEVDVVAIDPTTVILRPA
jgi:hypothetical protein